MTSSAETSTNDEVVAECTTSSRQLTEKQQAILKEVSFFPFRQCVLFIA
jgi:hypothetical protein